MIAIRKITKLELKKAAQDIKRQTKSLINQHCSPNLVLYKNIPVIYTTAYDFDFDRKTFVKGKMKTSLGTNTCLVHKTHVKDFISCFGLACPPKEDFQEHERFFNVVKKELSTAFKDEFDKLKISVTSFASILKTLTNESIKKVKTKAKAKAKKLKKVRKEYQLLILKETSVEDVIFFINNILNRYRSIHYDIRVDIENKLHHSASARSCLKNANKLLKAYGLDTKLIFVDKLLSHK